MKSILPLRTDKRRIHLSNETNMAALLGVVLRHRGIEYDHFRGGFTSGNDPETDFKTELLDEYALHGNSILETPSSDPIYCFKR